MSSAGCAKAVKCVADRDTVVEIDEKVSEYEIECKARRLGSDLCREGGSTSVWEVWLRVNTRESRV